VAGVLSGTSGDGIDVVLAGLEVEEGGGRVRAIRAEVFETRPFPVGLAPRVRAALDGESLGPRELALLNRDLGRAFGVAVREVCGAAGVRADLVGSHGLTIYHHDGAESSGAATLQIGDGDHVAEEAHCTVVSDFRQADIAAGGEGAPLSVLADDVVFATATRPAAILNLGGLANLSWLGPAGERLAFDTGPANSLLDGLARRLLERPFDAGGAYAATGRHDPDLLARWLSHPFYMAPPPKSTGRDTFGGAWVATLIEEGNAAGIAGADLLATAVELVAHSVVLGIERFLPTAPETLWIAGGGVHNHTLCAALERRAGFAVASSSELGVDPDAREALVFAVLAARCILGEPTSDPGATGAARGRLLGKISPLDRSLLAEGG